MKGIYLLLCMLLLLHSFPMIKGMPWESSQSLGRCMCLKETPKFIHPRRFQEVKIFQERHYCQKREIMIYLKENQIVCVDPKASWVEHVILGKRHGRDRQSRRRRL